MQLSYIRKKGFQLETYMKADNPNQESDPTYTYNVNSATKPIWANSPLYSWSKPPVPKF
jgi:hypothetical protein